MPSGPRSTIASSTACPKKHHKIEGQASPFWRRLAYFSSAMRGIRIVQIFFCTVASKRATFAPKRGMGEGGFFLPSGTGWEQTMGTGGHPAAGQQSPSPFFSKTEGLFPRLFPSCSHSVPIPVPISRKMAGAKKRITKPFFRLRTASWEQSILSINKKRI